MANKQIKDLDFISGMAQNDVLHVNDVSTGNDRKITVESLADNIIINNRATNSAAIAATDDTVIMTPVKVSLHVSERFTDDGYDGTQLKIPVVRDLNGIFGLGAVDLNSTADPSLTYNSINRTGFYNIDTTANTNGSPPISSSIVCSMTIKHTSSSGTQLALRGDPTFSNDIRGWIRGYNSSTGDSTNWAELYHTENLKLTNNAFDNTEGSIPKVRGDGGIFGLGSTSVTNIPNNNLNNITRTGMYGSSSGTLNMPVTGEVAGAILHISRSATFSSQLYQDLDDQTLYFRSKANNIWSDWKRVYTADEVPQQGGYWEIDSNITRTSSLIHHDVRTANDRTVTIQNDVTWKRGDTIIITKAKEDGDLTISYEGGGDRFYYPDGTNDTSILMPDGIAFTIKLVRQALSNRWSVSVLG